jgi:hypothetical protein
MYVYVCMLQPRNRSRKDCRKIFVHKDLNNCSHVFIRNDMVRKPLTPCYSGPYQVISRSPNTFAVKIADRQSNISMDRLKPAYIVNEQSGTEKRTENVSKTSDSNILVKCQVNTDVKGSEDKLLNLKPIIKVTQSGRKVRQPVRFLLS